MKTRLTFFISLLALSLAAQKDTSVFNPIKHIEAYDYTFSIPYKWTVYLQQQNGPQLQKLEFTDVALPHVYNNTPLTAYCLFHKINCDSLATAEDFAIKEFSSFPDRVTPMGYTYERDTVRILSGEQAVLYTTHYYRRSKASNFTRYEMLVYSDKRKGAYWFTITYQYKDPDYRIEFDLKLKEYALRIYRTLVLR